VIVTTPDPLPAAPATIEIHGCAAEAAHAHPAPAVTLMVRVPPAASTV
jgi:hypothetical protein